ncbi:putative ATP-grasp-modified RiPP [Microbispora sp. NBC_01389]|uniref:putative ATP-grasp-modified RiPP n=1 Tax=Microbispora sp. NBC_01389 TaxID=2903584 RepID=UPI003251B2F4
MATHAQVAPWAMRLVTDRLASGAPTYARVALDAATQTARYFDSAGQPIEMGKHGTNKTKNTASKSGGGDGDGNGPRPQTEDDTNTDYESD